MEKNYVRCSCPKCDSHIEIPLNLKIPDTLPIEQFLKIAKIGDEVMIHRRGELGLGTDKVLIIEGGYINSNCVSDCKSILLLTDKLGYSFFSIINLSLHQIDVILNEKYKGLLMNLDNAKLVGLIKETGDK